MPRLLLALFAAVLLSACAHSGPSTYTPGISNLGGRWVSIVELPAPVRQALEAQLQRKYGGLMSCVREAESVEVAAYFVRLDLAADGRHDGAFVVYGGNPNAAPGIEVCVRNKIRRWRFEPLDVPGTGVTVMIPLRPYADTYDMSRELM